MDSFDNVRVKTPNIDFYYRYVKSYEIFHQCVAQILQKNFE